MNASLPYTITDGILKKDTNCISAEFNWRHFQEKRPML